jgi:hypothetical protein
MAKKSRRTRRQESQKRQRTDTQPFEAAAPVPPTAAAPIRTPKASTPAVQPTPAEAPVSRKLVAFAEDYYYVYSDLGSFLIITVVMFAVLIGLSFVI